MNKLPVILGVVASTLVLPPAVHADSSQLHEITIVLSGNTVAGIGPVRMSGIEVNPCVVEGTLNSDDDHTSEVKAYPVTLAEDAQANEKKKDKGQADKQGAKLKSRRAANVLKFSYNGGLNLTRFDAGSNSSSPDMGPGHGDSFILQFSSFKQMKTGPLPPTETCGKAVLTEEAVRSVIYDGATYFDAPPESDDKAAFDTAIGVPVYCKIYVGGKTYYYKCGS